MKYRIGIIGFGGVSQAMIQILAKKRIEYIRKGYDFSVVGVSDNWRGFAFDEEGLDLDALANLPVTESSLHSLSNGSKHANNEKIISSDYVDVLIEATFTNPEDGQPGLDYCRRALNNRKHVITTNKGPVAFAGGEFTGLALKNDRLFLYEGSVMSGTPVLNLISSCLHGSEVQKISGILNGTSNYILSQMETGLAFEAALSQAQKLGYAENDPSADIGGSDVALKVLILAQRVMSSDISYSDIDLQGISELTLTDIQDANKDGFRWKLIGSCDKHGNASVKPIKLSMEHPLASVSGATNAILLTTDHLGDICISGPGAGREETGYALIADLLSLPV